MIFLKPHQTLPFPNPKLPNSFPCLVGKCSWPSGCCPTPSWLASSPTPFLQDAGRVGPLLFPGPTLRFVPLDSAEAFPPRAHSLCWALRAGCPLPHGSVYHTLAEGKGCVLPISAISGASRESSTEEEHRKCFGERLDVEC